MKVLSGIVVNNKMNKTVVVAVTVAKIHPLYQKRYRVKRKFLADDEIGVKKGQKVRIAEARPISKRKKWRVLEVLKDKKE